MDENSLEIKSSKKKIVYHFVVLALIFNLIITSSLAWFVSQRSTNVSDVGMSLEVDDTVAIYRAYLCDPETGVGFCRDKNNQLIDITNLNLNQYDTLFRTKNINTAAFAQIKIHGKDSMPESGTLYITIEAEKLASDGTNDENILNSTTLKQYTSNIARFSAFIYPDKDENQSTLPPDAAILYNEEYDESTAAAELFKLINTETTYYKYEAISGNDPLDSKTFITITNDGHESVNSITLSVSYDVGNWYKVEENGVEKKYLNVYLYITYDVELIEYYFYGIRNEKLDPSSEGIPFANDLKKITISYDK